MAHGHIINSNGKIVHEFVAISAHQCLIPHNILILPVTYQQPLSLSPGIKRKVVLNIHYNWFPSSTIQYFNSDLKTCSHSCTFSMTKPAQEHVIMFSSRPRPYIMCGVAIYLVGCGGRVGKNAGL